jgi:pimeloyl-ACP methyl ester carboxylesterase
MYDMPLDSNNLGHRLRPLGAIERAMAALHEQGGTTQTSSLIELIGPMSAALLEKAARHLQLHHTLLQAMIAEYEGALHFVQPAVMPTLTIRCTPISKERDQWESELAAELNLPLDPTISLWKLALLHDEKARVHTLILTCHHALVDAVSLVTLLSDLLQAADALIDNRALSLRPYDMTGPVDNFLRDAATTVTMPLQLEGPAYEQRAAISARRTAVCYDQCDSTQLEQIHTSARTNDVSLNSWLAAALLLAAREVGLGNQLCINSAVSMRERTQPAIGDAALGCFIRVAPCEFDLTGCDMERAMVTVAKRYHAAMKQQLSEIDTRTPSPDFSQLRANAERLAQASRFVQGIALTNHGRVQFPAMKYFSVQRYLNVANRCAGNFAVALHATSYAQTLTLSFTHAVPLIATATVVRLQASLRALLMSNPAMRKPAMKDDFFIHDGMRLRFLDSKGSGMPTFCFHGNSSGADAFASLFASLGRTCRLIAIDFPGHGGSARATDPAKHYSLDGLAKIVVSAVKHFGFTKYAMIGHSLGGHAALEALPQLPDLQALQALIMVAAPPFNQQHIGSMFAPDPSAGRVFRGQLNDSDVLELTRAFVNQLGISPARFEQAAELIRITDPALRESIGASLGSGTFGDEAALLSTAKVPALLVLGDADGFMQLEYCAKPDRYFVGKNLQVAVMKNCGHNPHFEQPDTFASITSTFIQQCS